jgi:hypothetical protein
MGFEKTKDYIECICNFLDVLNDKANKLKDIKLKNICKLILKYIVTCCTENKILITELKKIDDFDMKIVYEYINKNNIKIMDFNNIKMEDIDINNEYDIECFVLSHIYYIYENN